MGSRPEKDGRASAKLCVVGRFPVPRISLCGCVDTGSQGQPVGTTSQLEPKSFFSAKPVLLTDVLRGWRQCMCSLPSIGEDVAVPVCQSGSSEESKGSSETTTTAGS